MISSLLKNELRHKEALKLWESILSGKNFAVMPYSVLVEVVAAIRRRTGSEEMAIGTMNQLIDIEAVSFVPLDDTSAVRASELAAQTGVRGMDALVIQVAKEFEAELVTFDEEMLKRAKTVLP